MWNMNDVKSDIEIDKMTSTKQPDLLSTALLMMQPGQERENQTEILHALWIPGSL